MNEFKHLIVLTMGAYPSGGASTNRHLSYLKGLVELGINVKLLIIRSPNNGINTNENISGVYNGVNFEYIQPKIIIRHLFTNTFFKFKYRITAIFRTIVVIKENNTSDTKLLVLLSSFFDIFPYWIISKLYKVKIYHEITEHPALYMTTFFKKISLYLYLNFLLPQLDGIFVITNFLLIYLRKYVKNENKLIHIPITVELERFQSDKGNTNIYGTYIAYCGSMYDNIGIPMYIDKNGPVYGDKDGVSDLIKAFDYLCCKISNINLLLIGDNSDPVGFKSIQNTIDSSPNKKNIICTGKVSRECMPEMLKDSIILALARPDNLQAKGGFPTKLGEYLSTGNPVVITDVGEISDYLEDGVSAYISPPNNPELFGNKLIEAASDLAKSRKIGEEGRNVALKYFDYKVQSKRLYLFLSEN